MPTTCTRGSLRVSQQLVNTYANSNDFLCGFCYYFGNNFANYFHLPIFLFIGMRYFVQLHALKSQLNLFQFHVLTLKIVVMLKRVRLNFCEFCPCQENKLLSNVQLWCSTPGTGFLTLNTLILVLMFSFARQDTFVQSS